MIRAPWIHELHPVPDVELALRCLAAHPHCLFLDSALRHETLGRYSFLAADPFERIVEPVGGRAQPLQRLSQCLEHWRTERVPELPPFQGGAAGLIGYEFGRRLERIPEPRRDEFEVPLLDIGFYDCVVAFDHLERRAWIVSQGFPETDPQRRAERAERRGRQCLERLRLPPAPQPITSAAERVPVSKLAPQHAVSSLSEVTSNFSASDYERLVGRAVEYIHAGDIFQVNLAQRFLHPATAPPIDLYLRLRQRNRATFAAYYDLGEFQVLSASPERFVASHGGSVETRPIKGTRRRIDRPEADIYAAVDLSNSQKDLAENTMIVDLLRNDLSRVCLPDSVRVTQLCGVESYEYVQHLVSAVVGQLAPRRQPLDLVRYAFPGGSITGAPKIRAMEIIAELEPTARGPYCGSLGYLGFDGAMDLNILIRTITAGRGWWQLPAGGGIVADSSPANEYHETLHKARGMIRSLT